MGTLASLGGGGGGREGRDEWVGVVHEHMYVSDPRASLPPRLLRLNPPTADLNNRALITLT